MKLQFLFKRLRKGNYRTISILITSQISMRDNGGFCAILYVSREIEDKKI
jgi:hypothetical protein